MKKIWSVILAVAFFCAACVPFPVQAAEETGVILTFVCYNCDEAIRPALFMKSNFKYFANLPSFFVIKDSDMDTVYTIEYEEFYCSTCESGSIVRFQLASTGNFINMNNYGVLYIDPYVPDTLYVVFEKPLQGIITGDLVPNAEYYQLYEKSGTTYTLMASADEINFDLTTLDLAAGDHTFVVVACADGYAPSDYSNEVVYTVK